MKIDKKLISNGRSGEKDAGFIGFLVDRWCVRYFNRGVMMTS